MGGRKRLLAGIVLVQACCALLLFSDFLSKALLQLLIFLLQLPIHVLQRAQLLFEVLQLISPISEFGIVAVHLILRQVLRIGALV